MTWGEIIIKIEEISKYPESILYNSIQANLAKKGYFLVK